VVAAVTDLTIETERLLLRPLRTSDAKALFVLFADWEVIRWLSLPPWPYRLDDAREFIHGQLHQDLTKTTFALILADALIGGIDVRMNPAGHSQSGPGPNLGYWLGRRHWGRGYMTEAATSFVAHVFRSGIGGTIYSGAFADNAASLRVQEKLGFVHDGETMLYARPRNEKFPHINTRLTQANFRAIAQCDTTS
jgi:RimJ/RimL family protein N-acetyltransferase